MLHDSVHSQYMQGSLKKTKKITIEDNSKCKDEHKNQVFYFLTLCQYPWCLQVKLVKKGGIESMNGYSEVKILRNLCALLFLWTSDMATIR